MNHEMFSKKKHGAVRLNLLKYYAQLSTTHSSDYLKTIQIRKHIFSYSSLSAWQYVASACGLGRKKTRSRISVASRMWPSIPPWCSSWSAVSCSSSGSRAVWELSEKTQNFSSLWVTLKHIYSLLWFFIEGTKLDKTMNIKISNCIQIQCMFNQSLLYVVTLDIVLSLMYNVIMLNFLLIFLCWQCYYLMHNT